MKKKRLFIVAALALCGVICLPHVPGAVAYLTDQADVMMNPFTIALDSTSTVIEKFPVPEKDDTLTPVPNGNIIDYEKAVQIGNTGFIDEYVRVSIDFSDSDIQNKSKFSWDGVNWYTVADYKNHLPNGWVYNNEDGFYYYTPILYAENWDVVSKKLWYEKPLGEYFYPENLKDIISDKCITVPLIRYVKTEFSTPKDMRTYSIHVYNESVPFYFGNDYAQSWKNYLDMMKK